MNDSLSVSVVGTRGGKVYVSCISVIPAVYMFRVLKELIYVTCRACGLNTVAEQI